MCKFYIVNGGSFNIYFVRINLNANYIHDPHSNQRQCISQLHR